MWIRHPRVLLADDEPAYLSDLARKFVSLGWEPRLAGQPEQAIRVVSSEEFALAVVEPNLPSLFWLRFLRMLRETAPSLDVVVTTSFPSTALLKEASSRRVIGVLQKPVDVARILATFEARDHHQVTTALPSSPSLAWNEWEHLNRVLRDCDGNMTRTSRALGIPRQTLYNKLRKSPGALQTVPATNARHGPLASALK